MKTNKLKNRILSIVCSILVLISRGGVRGSTSVYADDFTLTANVDSTANNGLGNVNLDWSSYTNKNVIFKGYQSKDDGKTWQSISLMDYTSVKEIKVLQIYPTDTSKDQLKTWMETNGYGKGIIKTDAVYIDTFNTDPDKYLKNDDGSWKYDEIFFGTMDANAGKDLNEASAALTAQFIKAGGGCICGHDTLRNYFPYFWSLKDYFNISCKSGGGTSSINKVYISKKGLFTTWPWDIGDVGTVLTIPPAHSLNQDANGDIWLRFSGVSESNNNFYLTTWNNCAMIQTGHSNGAATEDEQKIIANLIFYAYQLSSETSVTDNSAMDNATPDKPTITKGTTGFLFASNDNGVTYQHKIEAYDIADTSKLIGSSNVTSSTIKSGLKGFRYLYDNNADTKITASNGTETTGTSVQYNYDYGYFHVAAIDNAGNVSETATVEMSTYQINYDTETIYPADTTAAGVAGGKISRSSEAVAGNSSPFGSTATASSGYTFDGWYSSAGEKVTDSTTLVPVNANADKKGSFVGTYGGNVTYDSSSDTYSITASTTGMSDSWGSGACHNYAKVNTIPWGNWYVASFEVWSPIDARFIVDINNQLNDGTLIYGNDNDNTSLRGASIGQALCGVDFKIKANTWTKVTFWYSNTRELNTEHRALREQHTLCIQYNKSLGDQTFKVRNYKAAISPTLIKELDTFTARFKPYEHAVAYNANGGSGAPETGTKYAQSHFYISKTVPVRTGYTFKSWNTKKDGSGMTYDPGQEYFADQNGGTVTLYAQWAVKMYKCYINGNGGTLETIDPPIDENGRAYFAATYNTNYFSILGVTGKKTGYHMTGVYDQPDGGIKVWNAPDDKDETYHGTACYNVRGTKYYDSNNLWKYDGNADFYIQYEPNNYTVTFDYGINVNSSFPQNTTITYDSAYGSIPEPKADGWTFKSWNTKSDGSGTTVTNDTIYKIAGDSTLYAQWSYNPISVKVPQILTGDASGNSSFRISCDNIKSGSIKVDAPKSFPYKQTGKVDVVAVITQKSGSNIITPSNKSVVYNISTNGLSAGSWNGSFNIDLTLTKE